MPDANVEEHIIKFSWEVIQKPIGITFRMDRLLYWLFVQFAVLPNLNTSSLMFEINAPTAEFCYGLTVDGWNVATVTRFTKTVNETL